MVRIVAREFTFAMPDTLPAGLVHVRFVNEGRFWHHALFSRLDSTQSPSGYLAEIREGKDFPSGAIDFGGPPLCKGGDSAEVIVRFNPGRWVALCTSSGGGFWHVAAGMLDSFVVVPGGRQRSVDEPTSDLTLVMRDDGFSFPDTVKPGRRWIRIEDRGARWHECDILRIEPGKTIADYRAWRHVEHLGSPPPAVPVGGCGDFIPGTVQWSLTDFRPGRYLFVCDMPGDSAHWREVAVAEASGR
jgi:hypothetical protein